MRFFFTIVAIFAAVAFAGELTRDATAQEQLPEQSAFLTACHTATQLGQIGGVNVSRCRKVSLLEEGNFALVTVRVWVDGQGIFLVRVALQKSVWMQSALDVQSG